MKVTVPPSSSHNWLAGFAMMFLLAMAIGVIGVLEVNQINGQFDHMYRDRLEPALDISLMLEKLYQNRLNLEEFVFGSRDVPTFQVQDQIRGNNDAIDSLIEKYTHRPLVPREVRDLRLSSERIRAYRKIESEVLASPDSLRRYQIFTERSYQAFRDAVQPVEALSSDQAILGRQLYEEAEDSVRTTLVVFYILMGVALLLTIGIGIAFSLYSIDR